MNKKRPLEPIIIPVKISLTDADKEDQVNFKEAVVDAHINAKVILTEDGQELMDNLHDAKKVNPDIIFLDNHMPLLNGKDSLTELKADATLKNIPTVIYSASNDPKDIDEAFKAGASLYVTKPIFFRNLVRIINKIFSINWRMTLLKGVRKNFLISETEVNAEETGKKDKENL